MIELLIAAIVAAILWRMMPPGDPFLRGFALFMPDASIHRGPLSVLTGRSFVRGHVDAREVSIRLQLARGRRGKGSLDIAMAIGLDTSLTYEDLERQTRDSDGRQALFGLGQHGLSTQVRDGWLHATWTPKPVVTFPGRFAEEKWSEVLDAMSAVAASIERGSHGDHSQAQ